MCQNVLIFGQMLSSIWPYMRSCQSSQIAKLTKYWFYREFVFVCCIMWVDALRQVTTPSLSQNAGYPSLGITRWHNRVGRLFLSHFLQTFVDHRGNDNLTFIETYIEIYMQVRMVCPLATTTIWTFVCIIDLNLKVKYNSLSLVW